MYMYTLLTTATLAALQIADPAPSVHGLERASCQPENERCTGISQGQADVQCCSEHCNIWTRDWDTGNMIGLCATSSASCRKWDQPCSGTSSWEADGLCCSSYCHVTSVDGATGQMKGLCQPTCKWEGDSCSGESQYKANKDCCSGNCKVLSVDKEGTHSGTCATARDCKLDGAFCTGHTYSEANAKCCSGRCYVRGVDRYEGYYGTCMAKRDYPNCKLIGQSCFGKSQYKADAQKGNLYGTCERATPDCKPITAACSGKYINDADAQCCSGNCGNLVFLNGEFNGRCTLFAEDGHPKSKQPAIQSPQNSAGEA